MEKKPLKINQIKIKPKAKAIDNNNPMDIQVGGDHYKGYEGMQPFEWFYHNKIPYAESSIIKYVLRHSKKNGEEDLDKAIHSLQMLKQLRYGKKDDE